MEADHSLEPTLTEMTAKAIEILGKNKNGYVLLVEGGLIDQAHHRNFAQMALNETEEFAKAIQYAKDATNEKDTLLVVTADHSHTFTVGGYPVSFSWTFYVKFIKFLLTNLYQRKEETIFLK